MSTQIMFYFIGGAIALTGCTDKQNLQMPAKSQTEKFSTKAVVGAKLADEGGYFTVAEPTAVRYGADGRYVDQVVNGTVGCNNQQFGDPAYGIVKECYRISMIGRRLAVEGETFTVSAPTRVQYGANDVYVEQVVNGTVDCTNERFGDPLYGVFKECLDAGPYVAPEPTPEQRTAQIILTTVGGAPIDSKEVYLDGHVSINANGTAPTNAFEADGKLKGRGNFTWGLDKKPYKIKLNSKASIMSMPADKEWVLLASHLDKTLIRTATAFEFSRRLNTDYTPRGEFVELTLNGRGLGSYMLTEQVKISRDRVNITELKSTDITGEAVTGGYLVELNERLDEVVNWRSPRGVAYSLKEPSEPPVEQSDYIRNYMNAAEAALYADNFADPINGYAKYIDVDSFINLFFIHELFKNKDAANFSSVFLVKERNQKLKMGPAWDFDLAGGNSNSVEANIPEGWWLRAYSPWYNRLFQDPAFVAKVKARWNEIKESQIDTLGDYIDKSAYRMAISQQNNFDIWKIMGVTMFDEVIPLGSYGEEVFFFKDWVRRRAAWIDQELNK